MSRNYDLIALNPSLTFFHTWSSAQTEESVRKLGLRVLLTFFLLCHIHVQRNLKLGNRHPFLLPIEREIKSNLGSTTLKSYDTAKESQSGNQNPLLHFWWSPIEGIDVKFDRRSFSGRLKQNSDSLQFAAGQHRTERNLRISKPSSSVMVLPRNQGSPYSNSTENEALIGGQLLINSFASPSRYKINRDVFLFYQTKIDFRQTFTLEILFRQK